MSVYIDLSEFLAVPMKTGIQRISGEICRYAPPNSIIPVRLHSDHYVALSPALIDVIGGYFRNASESAMAEIFRLGAAENPSKIELSSHDTVLVPEIFGEQRAAFFSSMPDERLRLCRFIIYDLLPFTHPEYFPPYVPVFLSAYFQVARRASSCGFISEYTRDVYYQRLKRTNVRGGVVLPLGSDSLGARATQVRLNRPITFSVLGTIEPRKNHHLILEAFEPLLRQIEGLRILFIGKMGWVNPEFNRKVQALATDKESGFEFHPALDDGTIRSYIEQSRATIYVSAAEGYGLPPVESLWLGTPVIGSKTSPSLDRLGSLGVHYVEPLTVVNLRRAILAFLNDGYANQKTEEAVRLNLPTWRSFTDEVLRWCADG
jgi:glycosyltransferase involved in cell wall biosynthesis